MPLVLASPSPGSLLLAGNPQMLELGSLLGMGLGHTTLRLDLTKNFPG